MLSTAISRRPPQGPASDEGGPLHVVVLMGGVGTEREVSLRTGRAVVEGLEEAGHEVESWVLDTSDPRALDALPRAADVVFLALHGEWGEDGGVQQALEDRGFVYTGSGPAASALAFDKQRTKEALARAGIPLAHDRLLPFPFGPRDLRQALRTAPDGWCVVKPVRMGSSVGVRVCRDRAQVARALRENAVYRQPQLIEEFIPGHELTVGIIEGEPLPLVEPVPREGVYDYTAKYDPEAGTSYRIEPETVPPLVREEARRIARRVHHVLGCRDVSRVDLRWDPERNRLVVLELNTLPGMTARSLLPKAAAAAGLPFPRLCERLCRLALGARRA